MRESRQDRFRRVAQARVNKILHMIRLLGNCSKTGIYQYTPEQVEQIFTAIRQEVDQAQLRFQRPEKSRFRLTEPEETTQRGEKEHEN